MALPRSPGVDVDKNVAEKGFPTTFSAYFGAVLVSAVCLKLLLLPSHVLNSCYMKFEVFFFGGLCPTQFLAPPLAHDELIMIYRTLHDLVCD